MSTNDRLLAEAINASLPDMPPAHVEAWARDIASILSAAGLALVKLPTGALDGNGASYWPVQDDERIKIRETDGRVFLAGVRMAFAEPEYARVLAGALLAAADHLDANSPA